MAVALSYEACSLLPQTQYYVSVFTPYRVVLQVLYLTCFKSFYDLAKSCVFFQIIPKCNIKDTKIISYYHELRRYPLSSQLLLITNSGDNILNFNKFEIMITSIIHIHQVFSFRYSLHVKFQSWTVVITLVTFKRKLCNYNVHDYNEEYTKGKFALLHQ